MRQNRSEKTDSDSEYSEESSTPDVDGDAPGDPKEIGTFDLDLLKSIPGTQLVHDDEDTSGDRYIGMCDFDRISTDHLHLIRLPTGETFSKPAPIDEPFAVPQSSTGPTTSHDPGPDPVASQGSPRTSPPLFLPESSLSVPPTPVLQSASESNRPPSSLGNQPLSDEELQEWVRSWWSSEKDQLQKFDQKGWGSAYQTVAEVLFLLRAGEKKLKMNANFACHHISTGRFLDEYRQERRVDFQRLGSQINGQTDGTWTNKVTFFFAVYHFLEKTEGETEESLGRELHGIRQAMATWGVFPMTSVPFLPAADPKTAYLITPIRTRIRKFMKDRK
jgi:hypothetical protein